MEILENGVLRFRDVTRENQGRYICTASNTAGTETALATLNIRGHGVVYL